MNFSSSVMVFILCDVFPLLKWKIIKCSFPMAASEGKVKTLNMEETDLVQIIKWSLPNGLLGHFHMDQTFTLGPVTTYFLHVFGTWYLPQGLATVPQSQNDKRSLH